MKKALIAAWLALGALLLAGSLAQAKEAAPLAEDPVIEQRMLAISEELRCLVCQNESLAGSRADLAQDLRRELRELLKAGKTDQEVKDFLVSRYGDFVLYRPQVKPSTYLLWAGPFVLLVAGLFGLIRFLRRRAGEATTSEAPLTEAERQRAEALLKDVQP
ncbi:MAG TPA: cytochrome c-type biogenesis protein CcmH [Burkholderiaceae bacterium]|nr:cytochrome c-type biogenesis protein CcmH [Burkholderiaceae bacterium]HMY99598.1 cytochrome c-type biogenesis protein CcmH [Burkholderiaceae bacterium]HNB46038.1 cytochrome c-type biogenesis protein CcmH [Burkholderiaceae bacterium]HNG80068.1 cytochrome c-type biogenesis protein CcmH [Burkholderiaceae bacterium]